MKCRRQIKTLIFLAAAIAGAGPSAAANVTIGKDKSDIALDASWSGNVAPGSGDSVNFGVDGFYGPFTMSTDVTYQRFQSGGWGMFDPVNGKAAQQFDLCGHTMTLTGSSESDSYVFNPCNNGPRNHFVFSNGKIAILQNGNVTIGWGGNFNSSRLRLTGIELTGVANLTIGMYQSVDAELRIDGGSVVSAAGMTLSRDGIGNNVDKTNRLLVSNASLAVANGFSMSSGGVVELAEGASFAVGTFQSGLLAGETSVLISNATLAVARAYETAKGAGSTDRTEVVGASALLKAKEICVGNNPDASVVILTRDGATVEGTDAVWVGNDGPATLTLSNANLKTRSLAIGKSADSAGSVLRLVGADALCDSYDAELPVGVLSTSGSRLEVADGAVCNLRRLFVKGSNTITVAGGTINISHGDSYHTSLVLGGSDDVGGRLVFSGQDPAINFTDYAGKGAFHGGVKAFPGTKVVWNLPAKPYATAPLDTYWLHMQYDETHPGAPLAEIEIGLSGIPKTHGRLAYKLLHVVDSTGVNAIHADAIARVNALPEVKAVRGRLAWKGYDLVFTVPSTLGTLITLK